MFKPALRHPRLGALLATTEADRRGRWAAFGALTLLALVAAALVVFETGGWVRYVIAAPLIVTAVALVVHGATLKANGILVYQRGLVLRDERHIERAVPMEDIAEVAWAQDGHDRGRFHDLLPVRFTVKLRSGEDLAVSQSLPRDDGRLAAVQELIARGIAQARAPASQP